MRDYKGMKRQRGRNRSGGGGQPQSGGKPGQNANRAFDSNGPDNIKVRGHAQHVYEKYNQLARDAAAAGDRVLAENHLQHAEHYFRTLRVLQPNRPVTEIVGRDTFVNGFDLDFEDEALESAMAEADASAAAGASSSAPSEGETQGEARADRFERQGGDRQNGDRVNADRQADGQRREYRQERGGAGGTDRARFDRQPRWEDRGQGDTRQSGERQTETRQEPRQADTRQDRQGGDRQERQGGDRSERPRYERQPRWEDRGERAGETVETAAMVAPESAAPPSSTFDQPYELSARESGRMLRSKDGGVSEAPAFLSSTSPTIMPDDGEPRRARARRPRRRPEGEAASNDGGNPDES